ncbi:uncharacterized protein A1O5_06987 [Cladophialophora psammophila CBS 110553]|uniref:EthD domain-containing protein n=1 Tax=Cladophialophora psammophila CBS 110553 TaxID=1182543 RepID=W9XHT8_9EURO|nr:uncharacterized protein A1O5_06987 [Cladophialophora psammophila CBS 110553]EXJ69914.1 hypothetical protein A1O5_06987 [Cladophialophora psammophila CBS 110553]
MHTTFAFLVKQPHLSTQEFITYYETKHIPMINRLAGPENQPLVYKRRYTHRDDPAFVFVTASVDASGAPVSTTTGSHGDDGATAHGSKVEAHPGNIDFDVMTEIGFADKEGKARWLAALYQGENAKLVMEDEARFIWRERTRAVVVEEFVSFG